MWNDDSTSAKKKASIASVISGILFGIAWWLYIDGAAVGDHLGDTQALKAAGYSWLPGVGCTISLIIINGFVSWSNITNEDDPAAACRARAFLVLGLIVGLGCIAAALFIMVEVFLNVSGAYSWAGISVFVQCLLIFVSAFIMRFGTMPSSEDVF